MGGTGVATRLRELNLSTTGVPTSDQSVEAHLRRFTAAGTGTSATPSINSPGSVPAAETTVLENLTVEPTYSAGYALRLTVNPRNNRPWVAYDADAEIVVPLTANNGLGVQGITVGGGAGNLIAEAGWREG
jgi:hypothetical protein